MSRSFSSFLLAALTVTLFGCSSDLPETSVRTLQDADGEDVLDAEGNPVRVRHVKRSTGWVPCDGPSGARKLVRDNEGKLAYAGQALVNRTCARGQCHSSAATGEARSGAPAGLDFDVQLSPLMVDTTDNSLVPDPDRSLLLAVHQRSIYDKRKQLWEQIDKGTMPPGGVGEGFRGDPGLTVVSLDQGTCVDGDSLGPVLEAPSKEELGVWLACGNPVVEASDERVTDESLGSVGNILPTCAPAGPGLDPSFDNVYSEVLGPSCATCHQPGGARDYAASDYSTPQTAYDNLVNAPVDPSCAGAPEFFVVPNDPEASYLLHKMGDTALDEPFLCPNTAPMPFGAPPLPAGTALIRQWIEAGAPGPGEDVPAGDGGV